MIMPSTDYYRVRFIVEPFYYCGTHGVTFVTNIGYEINIYQQLFFPMYLN